MTHWKRNIVFLLALMTAALLCACGGKPQTAEVSSPTASVSEEETVSIIEPEPIPEPELISYPGFIDQHFDAEHHTLSLFNDEENTVSFVFTLTDSDGEVLYTSKAVAPGKSVKWDVQEHWKKSGHHTLTISTIPVSEDGSEGNTLRQTIKVYLDY